MTSTRSLQRSLCAIVAIACAVPAPAGEPAIFADGFEDAGCEPLYAEGYPFEWSDLYFSGWPGYNQVVRFMPVPDSYISLRFTAGPAGQFGELLGVPVPPGASSAGWVAISRTRGCFDAAFNGSKCVSEVANTQSVTWTTSGPHPFRCELVPGQVYYVNLTLGGSSGPGPFCDRAVDLCILELGQFQN